MKLLQQTVRSYLLYSVFILLVAIPVFYLSIQGVLRHQADEALQSSKQILQVRLEDEFAEGVMPGIKFLDPGIEITQISHGFRDTLFTMEAYDSTEKEMIPYRIMKSNINLNGKSWLLTQKMSLLENDDLIKSILNIQSVLLILLLAGLFIINWRLSKRIWKPFYRTLEKLRRFDIEKDVTLELSKSGINEFDDLNQSLEGFADRTRQAFVSQKEFAENASHELQTPLAIMQGKLELLMQTHDLSEEQAILIDGIADAGQRMTRLNKSLILLTKIENNQFPEIEKISLQSVIGNFVHDQYLLLFEQKKLEVKTDFSNDILLNGNRTLIEIFTGNLLGNAIRYNNTHGVIHISMNNNMLMIANTGQQQSLNPDKIFNRFQKDGTDSDSLGLGLEIAKKIAISFGAQITYNYNEGLHIFTTIFLQQDHTI